MKLYLSLLNRMIFRHWREDALQMTIVTLILALGIGAYFSIRLANRAAVGGFEQFHSTLQSGSDWVLRGVNRGLSGGELKQIRRALHPEPVEMVPILETIAFLSSQLNEGSAGTAYRLIGVDLFQVQQWQQNGALIPRSEGQTASSEPAMPPLETLLDREAIWISFQLAERLGLHPDDRIDLLIGDQPRSLKVAGVLPHQVAGLTVPDHLLLMDLPALQTLLDRADSFDRVELVFPDTTDKATRMDAARERLAPLALTVESAGADPAGAEMTEAFRLNLMVLSLIALLVALYLITQALDANVVRRRMEIATLKSLGFTDRMIRNLWLVELVVLGLLGSVLGVLLGWAMAQATAGAVAQTVNALYYAVNTPASVAPVGTDWALALAIGCLGSILAGLLPIRDAAATPPAQILIARDFSAGFGVFRRPGLGLLLLAIGALALGMPPLPLEGGSRFPLGGYTAAFAWMLGGTLLTGAGFKLSARLLRLLEPYAASVRIARSRLTEPSSRHRLAVAGLFIAITMTASMSMLVASFSSTMTRWVDVRFNASLYGSSAGLQGAGSQSRISEAQWTRLEALDGVRSFHPYASLPIELAGKRTFLGGARLDGVGPSTSGMLWVIPPDGPVASEMALVNEAFAYRMQVGKGDRIAIPMGAAQHEVEIAGIFADYGNEQGTLLLHHHRFMQWTGIREILNFSIELESDEDVLSWISRFQTEFPGLYFRENENLRNTILRIFRQTFAVTEVLQLLGLFVALVGLALAQWNLLRESRKEWVTLTTMGATRGLIGRATALECAALGAIGYAGGVILSFFLGMVLIYVINRQSFGWTLLFSIPWTSLVILGLTTLLASAGIGLAVGRQSARLERLSMP